MVKDIHFPPNNQTNPPSSLMIFPPCSKKPKGQRVVHRNFWISWGKLPLIIFYNEFSHETSWFSHEKWWVFPWKIVIFPFKKKCAFPMKNCDFPMKNGDFAIPLIMTCTSFHAMPICWNKSSIRWSPSTTSFPAPLATSWCTRVNGDSIYLP